MITINIYKDSKGFLDKKLILILVKLFDNKIFSFEIDTKDNSIIKYRIIHHLQ